MGPGDELSAGIGGTIKPLRSTAWLALLSLALLSARPVFSAAATLPILTVADQDARRMGAGGYTDTLSLLDASSSPATLGWQPGMAIYGGEWPALLTGADYFSGGFDWGNPGSRVGGWALNYVYYTAGSQTIYDFDGTSSNVMLEQDSILSLSTGNRIIDWIYWGAALKYISSDLAQQYSAATFALDLQVMFKSLDDKRTFSLYAKNLGYGIKYSDMSESLPLTYGFSYEYNFKPRPNHKVTLSIGVAVTPSLVGIDGEALGGLGDSLGFEWFPGEDFFSLRTGVDEDHGQLGYTAGCGINLNGFGVEFAYVLPLGDYANSGGGGGDTASAGQNIRFSMDYVFGETNDYARALEFQRRGMADKAIALWRGIPEGEDHYADAQEKLGNAMAAYNPAQVKSIPKLGALQGPPPVLHFRAYLVPDDNGNGLYEPGERLTLKVKITNDGKGEAAGLHVHLQGDPIFLHYLGITAGEFDGGDLGPGETKELSFGGNYLPGGVPRQNVQLQATVADGRGFSADKVLQVTANLAPKQQVVVRALDPVLPAPSAGPWRGNVGALIVGISDYPDEIGHLRYASKDADLAYAYFKGALGIPEKNIILLKDGQASGATIRGMVRDRLAEKHYDTVFFYYSGHGMPDPKDPRSGQPFLVPHDANLDLKDTLIPVNELARDLEAVCSKTPPVLILDACFSGAAGGHSPVALSLERGIAIESKFEEKKAGAVIVSASSGRQPSLEYEDAGHGYFSYFFFLGLKGGADTVGNGKVTLGDLMAFVNNKMDEALNGRQSPEAANLSGSESLELGHH